MMRLDIWKGNSIEECLLTTKHVVELRIVGSFGYLRCAAVSIENVTSRESRIKPVPFSSASLGHIWTNKDEEDKDTQGC